jgi:dTDP-4-dehydrorhamnose reductase
MVLITRLVVVGATGHIGGRILAAAAPALAAIGTSSTAAGMLRLDLLRPQDFDYARLGAADVVTLAAGISAPDACARDPERAWALNVEGTAQFMQRALERGARVIFFSSDTVYGEREDEFDEAAPSNPAGAYSTMKHALEERFAGDPRVRTLRLSYVFSNEDRFTQYLRGCAGRNQKAEIFHPFYRAVVHREDVVDGVLALARRWEEFPQAVLNFGGPEVIPRTEFAQALKDRALPRLEFATVEPAADFFVQRPRVIRMRSPHLAALLGRPSRRLREAISLEFGSGRK